MKAIPHLIAASTIACASFASAGTPQLAELGRHVPGFELPGEGGFAIADFDGDGLDDLVVPARAGTAMFQVYGKRDGAIAAKQALFVPDRRLARVLVADVAGDAQLVTVSSEGVVRRFAGWPLVEVQTLELGLVDVTAAAIGDIDADGELDLVTSTALFDCGLRAHVLATGTLRWHLGDMCSEDLLLAQLDGDAALEIVTASVPGNVLDGATQATDWSYPAGFGSYLAAGHFQPGGGAQFVGAESWFRFTVFQSAPWLPLWEAELDDIAAIHAADLDGDGVDEIIEGDGQWGVLHVYDSHTHAVRLTIPHVTYSVSALDDWDPQGDGTTGIVFSPEDALHHDEALVSLLDGASGTTRWDVLNERPGPYDAIALGRIGGATGLVYAAHSRLHESIPVGPWVQIDAGSGAGQWQSPEPTDLQHPFAITPRATRLLGADGPSPQLLLAGNHWSHGARYLALDATTRAVRWVVDGTTWPALDNREVADAKEVDLDGTPAIVSCLHGNEGARLFLMDAASGAVLWQSVAMNTGPRGCIGLVSGRFEDDGDPLVVAVFESSIRAFNANTRLLEWTFSGEVDGASLVEGGAGGREFAVFKGSQLRFLDAGSRKLLREFDLGEPVTALSEVDGDIRHLLVAAGGRLLLVDGASGSVLQSSDYLGDALAAGNRLAVYKVGVSTYLVGAGSAGGVFRFRLNLDERIFEDGFE
jgi:outer membrane protein assembly factor BamB